MATTYTVLRAVHTLHAADPFGGGFLGPAAAALGAAPEARVEVAELNRNDVRDLQRDPQVAAMAPTMPLLLIEPFEVASEAAAAAAWGIGAVGADISPFSGQGVPVAVLDTGIDATHPAFAGVTLEQKDFTGDGDGDVRGHGTHCSGTIFGRDVNGTRIGVARGVSRALIGKILADNGRGESDWLFKGIQWALDRGARVISMSLGFDFPGLVQRLIDDHDFRPDVATSLALESYRGNLRVLDTLMSLASAHEAIDGGAVIVAASGNESGRDEDPPFEIAVSVPAAANGVLSVGALGESGPGLVVAPFSNTLPEIAAPGVGILSARAGGGLRTLSGTSMATPHVAGLAALWWEALHVTGSPLRARNVVAKLLASARTASLAPGFEVADCGVGVATAPA
jgi:subtilisin family serine protease